MMIDGEKYACEACIRGHRVNSCNHPDRILQHVNKRGRPVSQCQHCRNLRALSSAHVRCKCGQKINNCVHLDSSMEGDREGCCCNHGERCTCAYKKELRQLDVAPESHSDEDTSNSTRLSSESVQGLIASAASSVGNPALEESDHTSLHQYRTSAQNSTLDQFNQAYPIRDTIGLVNWPFDASPRENGGEYGRENPAASWSHQNPLASETSLHGIGSSSGSSVFRPFSTQPQLLELPNIEYPAPADFGLFGCRPDAERSMLGSDIGATSIGLGNDDFSSPNTYFGTQHSNGFNVFGSEWPATASSADISMIEDQDMAISASLVNHLDSAIQ